MNHFARLFILGAVCSAAAVLVSRAQLPEYEVSPLAAVARAMLEYATLTSSGNTLVASRVPVQTAAGTTIYKDITLQFTVDTTGNLKLATGFPKFFVSSQVTTAGFKAGRYVGPGSIHGGKMVVTVSGPGATSGGATQWSLAAATGADYQTYPSTATWYVGPIGGTPVAARLQNAGITSTAWSYGVATGSDVCCPQEYNYWRPGALIGVSQTGNAITIASFTYFGDKSAPVDQITYTLAP